MKNLKLEIFSRFVIYIFLLTTLHSCSIVTEKTIKDKPIWRFGIVKLDIDKPGSGARKLDIMTIGLWSAQESTGMGYNNMKSILLNDSCRVVFIVDNDRQMESMKLFLKESDSVNGENICLKKN